MQNRNKGVHLLRKGKWKKREKPIESTLLPLVGSLMSSNV